MQGPARTGPKGRLYLEQARKDQVTRHSDGLVDPGGSPGTFQNSTECHLGGRAHSRACTRPGIRPELKGTGSSEIHKLGSDLSRSHQTWQTFQS